MLMRALVPRRPIASGSSCGESSSDDESSEEEMPDEFKEITSKEAQQRAIIKSSLLTMSFGTAIVLLFSDPMVDVMSEIGNRTGIPPFFVAFVLAPVASNASELLAAYNYALKKTVKTMNVSLSTLLGAANMNNTFCLGIFLALIAIRPLKWTFSAETIAILVIELVMFFMACKTVHRLIDAFLVMLLFPLSIVLVYVLEYPLGLN